MTDCHRDNNNNNNNNSNNNTMDCRRGHRNLSMAWVDVKKLMTLSIING